MPYILAIVIFAVAVVLGIFTGIWGGLVWVAVAAVALAVVFAARARSSTIRTADPEPTGAPRGGPSASGTANERVGQG